MVVIKIKGNNELGTQICEALAGNKAFVENDIVVNYTDEPGNIYIALGEHGSHDIELSGELDSRNL